MPVLYIRYSSLTRMHTHTHTHTHTYTHAHMHAHTYTHTHIHTCTHTHTGSTSNSPLSTEEIARIITHYITLDSVSWKHSTLSLEVLACTYEYVVISSNTACLWYSIVCAGVGGIVNVMTEYAHKLVRLVSSGSRGIEYLYDICYSI